MSSSSSTPAQERDTQLLGVGKQCSDPTCLLIDFLPFKCHHCELSFCQEHFKVDAHRCSKYDESKHNRVAPNCPLCNTPVAVRPGQDPNVRMDFHLERECSVVTGKVNAKSTPLCARSNCKKVLFSPIRCTTCRQQFCPAHRFPGDHSCSSSIGPAKHTTPTPLASWNASAKNFNAKATVASAATVNAIKQGVARVSVPVSRPGTTSTSFSKPSMPPLPFNKMDRLFDVPSSTSNINEPNETYPAAVSPNPPELEMTTPTPNIINDDTIIKSQPVINLFSWNFIPRPIFASA